MPKQACRNCLWWGQLVPGPKSWGVCQWNPATQEVPQWLKAHLSKWTDSNPSGSVDPDYGTSCATFTQKP
jgi:hypothetical protein